MSVPSYPFHSLPLKLSNKGIEEYSKIIFFIYFLSIPFFSPKRGLNVQFFSNIIYFFFWEKVQTLVFFPYKQGRNTILVPTFWDCSQFGPYILVAVNLVPVIFNLESIWSLLFKLLMENVYMANYMHCWHT